MDENIIGKYLVETILGVFVSALSYFYKRDKASMDKEMNSMKAQLEKHEEVLNEKMVKKEDFQKFEDRMFDRMDYLTRRVDEIATSK